VDCTPHPRGGPADSDQAAIPIDVNHPADDRARLDGLVARPFRVTAKLEEDSPVARRHADDTMSEQPRVMTAEQDVSANHVAGGHRCHGDDVAVPDGGMHALAFGPEAHHSSTSQRVFDHDAEGFGMSHA